MIPTITSNPNALLRLNRTQPNRRSYWITGFERIAPRFQTPQEDLLQWLIQAHTRSIGKDMSSWVSRYSASSEQIAFRGHELPDFTHFQWETMRLFGGDPSDITQKTKFFSESVDSIFERLYPPSATVPEGIVHVTCTGYSAPSGAQRLVSLRGWGHRTQVIHAYHMGCYAAHPALRIACGMMASPSALSSTDVVHTELCSLHLDLTKQDPASLVIQSLFADGFIKYKVGPTVPDQDVRQAALQILQLHEEIISNSQDAMRWAVGPLVFDMTLSREVPALLADTLPRFVRSLFEKAGLDFDVEKRTAVFAIHPGGPRIIESFVRILQLEPSQAAWSWNILRDHGNMSSATLPHIWLRMLEDAKLPDRTLIVSLGAGPGLTLSGALLVLRRGEEL